MDDNHKLIKLLPGCLTVYIYLLRILNTPKDSNYYISSIFYVLV